MRARYAAYSELLKNLHRTHPWLLVILAFTLITRLAIYITGQPWDDDVVRSAILHGDGTQYHEMAIGLLNGTPLSETNWATDRTLGYPFFVTGIYAVSNNAVWLVLAVQMLMNVLMVPIVYWASLSIFKSQRAGIFAAGIFALSVVPAIWATRQLFTETLFTLVLAIFIAAFVRSSTRASFRWFLLLGVLLGIGTIVRSVLQYYIVIPVFIILIQGENNS